MDNRNVPNLDEMSSSATDEYMFDENNRRGSSEPIDIKFGRLGISNHGSLSPIGNNSEFNPGTGSPKASSFISHHSEIEGDVFRDRKPASLVSSEILSNASKAARSTRNSLSDVCTVNVFDVRTYHFSDGAPLFLDVNRQLIRQRISTMYNVHEENFIFMQNQFSEQNIITVAIIDKFWPTCLTLFVKWGACEIKCISVPEKSTLTDAIQVLENNRFFRDATQSYSLFCNNQKLYSEYTLVDQGVVSGCEIVFLDDKPVTWKCLYRSSPITDIIYNINGLSTDSVREVKIKIIKTIHKESLDENLKNKISLQNMWLTIGNRLYSDKEYLGSPSILDKNNVRFGLSNIVDVTVNVCNDVESAIPVNIFFNTNEDISKAVEKIIVTRNQSSLDLRCQIAKVLKCYPNALKVSIGDKKLPERDSLINFQELKPNCNITASLRSEITVIVNYNGESHKIYILKLASVLTLKKKFAEKIKTSPKQVKLCFEDKELNDYHRVEQVHIKDNTDITAEIFEARKLICIRKNRCESVHVIVDDCKTMRVRDFKRFYVQTIKLSSRLDIEFHQFNALTRFKDDDILVNLGTDEKINLYATEKCQSNSNGSLITIFHFNELGQIEIKTGAIIKNCILFATDDCSMSMDSCEDEIPEPPCAIPGIRLAYHHEMAQHKLAPLKIIQPAVPSISINSDLSILSAEVGTPEYQFRRPGLDRRQGRSLDLLEHGVVTDQDLDRLVTHLPGNSWEPFMRELLPNETITKIIESNKTVEAQIFNCLMRWKNKVGVEATELTLQEALIKHDLKLTSEKVFGVKKDDLMADISS